MTTKTRLNMEHGFMQSIIRNQLDRDNYDKEMKAKASKKTTLPSLANSKPKKPDMHTYAPPMVRSQEPELKCASQKEYLFTFEYEDEEGEVFHLIVNKGDDAFELATQFGEQRGLEVPLVEALANFLSEQIEKFCDEKRS